MITQPLPVARKERIIDEEGKERRNFDIRRDERENLRRALLINLDQDGMISINKIDEIISRMNDADKEAILCIDPDRRARIMARKEKLSQKEKRNLRVVSSDVRRVMNYFEIDCDPDLIERIFGSTDKSYMECSIKKLRDRMVHTVNDNVLRVILERYSQMNEDMDAFEDLFLNHVGG